MSTVTDISHVSNQWGYMHTEQCVYGLVVFGIVRVGHTLIAAKQLLAGVAVVISTVKKLSFLIVGVWITWRGTK